MVVIGAARDEGVSGIFFMMMAENGDGLCDGSI